MRVSSWKRGKLSDTSERRGSYSQTPPDPKVRRIVGIIIMETKKTHIVRQLRQLWLRSAERSAALKRAGYACEECGVKQSKAKGKVQKVEVHHKEGVLNWDEVIAFIRLELLCDESKLKVLCPDCHAVEDG